jgi:predicted amidohydrolase
MALLRVALLQLAARRDHAERALSDGEQACREAARRGADVAVMPEIWQIGYAPLPSDEAGRERWLARATASDGDFVEHFRALGQELGMAIAVTYLERWDGGPRNAARLIDRHGDVALHYAKVHTCDFGLENALTPGEEFGVCELDTETGPVRVGMMICFDREHPESARALMLGGAELILVPNSCVIDVERMGQLRARAFENMTGVAMANYATSFPGNLNDPGRANGHSVAFSGICYEPDGSPRSHKLAEAGEEEEIVMATFDLDALRDYRSREPWGAAYRMPEAYGALLGDCDDPVFDRPRGRRKAMLP